MGIDALVPVQEAFHINLVAYIQGLYRGIDIRGIVAQIGLYRKGIGLAVRETLK